MSQHLLVKEEPMFPSLLREMITVTVSILVKIYKHISKHISIGKKEHSMVGDLAKMGMAFIREKQFKLC
jgi:hypothetical protein